MKAAIYNRKSTDTEDKQVLSIESQDEYNLERIKDNGDELIETYQESRSAMKPYNRPEFSRLTDDIRSGKIEVIYCWKLNRLARNAIDGGEIQWLLQQGIIKKIVTSERTYLPSDNVLMMMVEMGMAIQFSRDLGRDAKRGMKKKAEMGWFPGVVPVGYSNSYGQKGEKYVLKDPERFDIVKRCWDMLLADTKTVKDIHRIAAKDWGLTILGAHGKNPRPISRSSMYNMFSNPFYCGKFRWDGKIWQGKHPPMITVEEYDKAQEILGPRGKPRLIANQNVFAGLIFCGSCGSAVIMDVKRKMIKSKGREKEFKYFRCSKMGRKASSCVERGSVNEGDIKDQIFEKIDSVDIPEAFVDWMLDELRIGQADIARLQEQELSRLQKKYKEAEEKVNKLVKRQLDKSTEVSEDLFRSTLKELETDRDHWNELINDFHATAKQRTQDTVESVNFAHDIRQEFEGGDRDRKVEILRRIGQSIELKNKTIDFRLRKSFSAFKECNDAVKAKLGSIEPLKMPLVKVKNDVLEQVVPIWLLGLDSNQQPID